MSVASDTNSLSSMSTKGPEMAAGTLPQAVLLADSAIGKTSKLFTKSQRAYLNGLKVQYIQCPRNLRAELTFQAADHLLERLEKNGTKKTAGEKTAFRKNVRRWFQQNCRAQKDLPKWATQWTGRLVYYHQNPDPVKEELKRLRRQAGEIVPEGDDTNSDPASEDDEGDGDGDESTHEEVDYEGDESDASNRSPVKMEPSGGVIPGKEPASTDHPAKRNSPPAVKYFQKALSNVYSALPSLIRKRYEQTAREWRMNGPDDAVKRRLADKDLPRISRHFAETVHRQMNVRVAMFVTYVGESGETVVSFLDYTDDFGVRSFTGDYGSAVQSSGIMGYWGAYARSEFENDVKADQPQSDQIRKRGKPLLNLRLNAYGEPIIPDPADIPPGEQPGKYLKRLIRNVVIYTYARACGREPKDVGPPWGRMRENIRDFIDPQYLPDENTVHFQEPTGIKVKPAREILALWYERQQRGQIALDIHNTIDDEGSLVPRLPRELIEVADEDPDYEDDGVVMVVPKGIASAKDRRKSGIATDQNRKKRKGRKGGPKGEVKVSPEVDRLHTPGTPPVEAPRPSPDLTGIRDGNLVSTEKAGSSKPRPRPRIRRAISSESDTDSIDRRDSPAFPPPPSPTPFTTTTTTTTPAVSPPPAPQTAVFSGIPDLASLDESIRNLVLDTVKKHLGSSLLTQASPALETPPFTPTLQPSHFTPPPSQPVPVQASTSNSTDLTVLPHQLADHRVDPQTGGESSLAVVDAPSTSRKPTRRTRKTEEERLLEAAITAGAKSGPRKVRKTTRAI